MAVRGGWLAYLAGVFRCWMLHKSALLRTVRLLDGTVVDLIICEQCGCSMTRVIRWKGDAPPWQE